MKINERRVYARLEHKTLRSFFRRPLIVLLSHWIFQGSIYMDPSERWFKIGLDLVATILIGLLLSFLLPCFAAFLFAFLISHTLNFLFNGHLWAALRFFGVAYYPFADFNNFKGEISGRIQSENCFIFGAAYGSVSRDEWGQYSDLDIRLVRCSGFVNSMRACTFVLIERARAFVNFFPLDIYVFDHLQSLDRLRHDEVPQIIKNTECYRGTID